MSRFLDGFTPFVRAGALAMMLTLPVIGVAYAQMTPNVRAQRQERRLDRLQHRRDHITDRIHHLRVRLERLEAHHRMRRAERVTDRLHHLMALRARINEKIER